MTAELRLGTTVSPLTARPRSLWLDAWRQVRKNRLALAGLVMLALLVFVAVAAPFLAPYDPNAMTLDNALAKPTWPDHALGTDELGRDILSRVIYGARPSLSVGLIVIFISGTIGVSLGAISGYFGGLIDMIIMRVVDLLFAFPFLVLALAVVSLLGPSFTNMMIVLGCVGWITYARMVRAEVLALREMDYVNAARVVGAGSLRILFRHILPNCLGLILVQATFGMAAAVISASSLSFLGMGVQPPTAEWGAMLSTGKNFLTSQPFVAIAPGVAIMVTVLAINLLGDALRDALDPRLRG